MANFRTQGELEALIEAIITALHLVGQELERIEEEMPSRSALETMYRSTHTIGRSASMLVWPALAQTAHGMEGILADALDGLGQFDASSLAQLRESYASMQHLVARLPAGRGRQGWPPPVGTTSEQGRRVIESTLVESGEERRAPPSAPSPRYTVVRLFTGKTAREPGPVSPQGEPEENGSEAAKMASRERGTQVAPASTPPAHGQSGPRPQERPVDRAITLILSLQSKRSTGTLRLRRGHGITAEEGWIRFSDGQITEAQVGRHCGAEARNRLSTWTACRYTYEGQGPGP
jgi:chemotaxis protein histidine kinase CheA